MTDQLSPGAAALMEELAQDESLLHLSWSMWADKTPLQAAMDELKEAGLLQTLPASHGGVEYVWEWSVTPRGKAYVAALRALATPRTSRGCICQNQYRRGYCTEPGCPYARFCPPD
jgi:hypothetical protein